MLAMRKRRRRQLRRRFASHFFKPQGVPLRELEIAELSQEELEALKLRYIDNVKQEKAAEMMGISQSQYQRDLWNAHKKIAGALIEGQAIEIME